MSYTKLSIRKMQKLCFHILREYKISKKHSEEKNILKKLIPILQNILKFITCNIFA